MRLAAVGTERGARIGVVSRDQRSIHVLGPEHGTVDDVVCGAPGELDIIAEAASQVPATPIEDAQLAAPMQRFTRDVLCVGWNYLDHFFESAGKREGQDPPDLPAHPTFFGKSPYTVIGPTDDIAYDPALSAKWDYEAELALVIGRPGRSISEEDAWDHVFGYFVANDVSQRDLQRAHGGQWLKGKSIDASMPTGPWITTADEIADLGSLTIQCELNGQTVQKASIADMAFSIPQIIAELSRGMTLHAGDVVLTGTPSGIGNAREPQLFLKEGDVLVTRVSRLGVLTNRVAYRPLT